MNEILNVRNQSEMHTTNEMIKHINFLRNELWKATGEYREELLEELKYHQESYYNSIGK